MPFYFEGWYFKQQTEKDMLALIPAYHTDGVGNGAGSLQIITKDNSWYVPLPEGAVEARRRPIFARAGDSVFSLRGIDLNVQTEDICAAGRLTFRGTVPPRGDIMGPYRFVPFMECRHSVFSMTHAVDGRITLNGTVLDFTGGTGYTEGDRGRSFPKRYIWTQCSWTDGGPCALMLSAAVVRPLGREFIGVIGFVLYRGREIRIATYHGARTVQAGNGTIIVRQGNLTITARLLEAGHQEPGQFEQALRAPTDGGMTRIVRESLSCRASFKLTERNATIFDFETDRASFEYEF